MMWEWPRHKARITPFFVSKHTNKGWLFSLHCLTVYWQRPNSKSSRTQLQIQNSNKSTARAATLVTVWSAPTLTWGCRMMAIVCGERLRSHLCWLSGAGASRLQPRNSSGCWICGAEPATNALPSTAMGIQAPILFLDPWNFRATQASCRSFLPVNLL